MSRIQNKGIFLAVLAAALYAISSPFSKLLLEHMPSTIMAGLLYLGAGIGMSGMALFRKQGGSSRKESRLTKAELPATVAMILLDIAAPVFLLLGLKSTSAASASLLNNFEITATALIALLFFREKISFRLWLGILFVTVSCMLLSVEDFGSLNLSPGCLFILLAASCWGLENNCTRILSSKDPLEIVLLKGIFSGTGSVLIGLLLGERITELLFVPLVMLLGFVSYGLSIYFYVYAQRLLGASRTSAYYAVAPFIGSFLSLLLFRTLPGSNYMTALCFMLFGAWLCSSDRPLIIEAERFAPKIFSLFHNF